MKTATQQFIRLYEDLVEQVNRRAGAPSSHSFEIDRAASRDVGVRKQKRLLKYIRDVRHALQHPQHRSPGHAVVISEPFLEEIQSLLEYLRNPPTASQVGVPRKKIRVASLSDRLGELADAMKLYGFSHIPILDDCEAVVGVFNEASVFDHLWSDSETIIGRNMLVSDIFRHCRLDANHTESFRFVTPRTPLDELGAMFLAIESPTSRVGAAFVTASGKPTEPLQFLITPWDVLATTID